MLYCPMENNGITIPAGTRKEDIKAREKIFRTISVSNINPSTKHTTRLQEDTNLSLLYSV